MHAHCPTTLAQSNCRSEATKAGPDDLNVTWMHRLKGYPLMVPECSSRLYICIVDRRDIDQFVERCLKSRS